LEQRQCVVIGGGQVASRKAAALLEAGARVTVISPAFCHEFDVLLQSHTTIECIQRPYQPGDLTGAFVAVSATDDVEVNQAVYAEAIQRGILINVVDDPAHSNFIVPATIRRGEVALSISTGGASPALARRLRERLEAWLSPAYGDLAALLEELRPTLKQRFAPGEPRLQAALRLVDSDLLEVIELQGLPDAQRRALQILELEALTAERGIPGRPSSAITSETAGLISDPGSARAHSTRQHTPGEPAGDTPPIRPGNGRSEGFVSLIGAGPGDPGLLTLRGAEALRQADVVVFDRLANPNLLALCPPAVERIDVGKQPDHHPVPQESINQILVDQARLGRRVARLKGGDPFVFGRGGEEALALAQAGIAYEIIPGVSSAIAVPAYAGIPVTQRSMAGSFVVIAGHRSDESGGDGLAAAAAADTRVFLMGVQNLPTIVQRLVEQGVSVDTPVAVVASGTTPQQQVICGALGDIVERAKDVQPPAITIVGQVAGLRSRLQWFDDPHTRPLFGLRVLNTRAAENHRRDDFHTHLERLGAQVMDLPATRLAPPEDSAPLQAAIEGLSKRAFDWIFFPSANAVTYFFQQLEQSGDLRQLGRVRLGAVGPVTADALHDYHLKPDFLPSQFTGLDWVNEVGDLHGRRILIPRSDVAPHDLITALESRGAQVQAVVAYRTLPGQAGPEALRLVWEHQVDVISLFSPSALDGLLHMLAQERGSEAAAAALNRLALACIGPSTAQAARKHGLKVEIIADTHTADGLAQALVQWRGR
jgi:uroporphyrinogen III methyltransferase/synthase